MDVKKSLLWIGVALAITCLYGPKLIAKEQVEKKRPRMDLAFCIDTTGSMQAEIDMVKSKVKELVAKLSSGTPAPDVRVGMVAFRDRGDTYVTKVFPFTDDIDAFVKEITNLRARGGGDGPEAVNEALHAATNDLQWDKSNKAAKLLFLIGDAGPKSYRGDYKWEQESRQAIARGIQINTIGCDGLQNFPGKSGMDVFKQIAKLADGQFELLAYKQTVTRRDGTRKVLVRAGGEAFELSEDAVSSKEWKRGARTLLKAGKAKRVSAPAAMMVGRAKGFGLAGARYAAADMEVGGSAPLDRRASNLDSILIRAAQKKAEKSLNVKYSD